MAARETEVESWICASEAETLALGRSLARRLGGDGVLLLEGALGSGKTVLARGVAEELGVDPAEVQSPTFTLIHQHTGRRGITLHHLDLYRLDPEEVESVGAYEVLEQPGVKVVEWAERLIEIPAGALRVRARRTARGERRFDLVTGEEEKET
ncbi:MAG TPA: tRNA (adenosine(37)-N6)-threonylcarbamoyltransferase complex ATPase subunit type 1 TsaE [Thermoanaerobaculia bacterium]|nr:tRNA (adenosine(37)-N6)-threonylcarbamoyltransferase complex ATPase subunit type 1 TsaE [Thermoanaerobaculia bacterium]